MAPITAASKATTLRWAATVGGLLAPVSAGAAQVEVVYTAPAGCPDKRELIRHVEDLIGRGLDDPEIKRIRVDARISHDDESYLLTVEVSAEGGKRSRQIRDPSCARLTEAAAVVVALAIEEGIHADTVPDAMGDSGPAAASPGLRASPAMPPAAPNPSSRPPGRAQSRRGPALRLLFGAGATLDMASLPAPAPGVEGAAGVGIARARLEATGAHYFDQHTPATDGRAGGDLSLSTGGLRACGAPILIPAELALCGGAEAGAVHAIGTGVDVPRDGTGLWLALTSRASLTYELSSVGLTAAAEAVIPLFRQEFFLDGIGEVHRSPPVSVRFFVGAVLRIDP